MDAKRKFLLSVTVSLVILLVVIVIAPSAGGEWVNPLVVFVSGAPQSSLLIMLKSRIPRVVLGVIAGASLSVCGAMLQAMLRNPLADPFTLGIASGGAMGAAIAMVSGLVGQSPVGIALNQIFSMAGSLICLVFIILAAWRFGLSSGSVILTGISINIVVTSGILFIQYIADISQSHLIVRWLMGELGVWGFGEVLPVAVIVLPGIAVSILISAKLNHLITGEVLAGGRGINVNRVYMVIIIISSLMTGAVVSVCGPIGFVGLVVPHIVRFITGYDNRIVIPVSASVGAIFLLLCDTVARTIASPSELPVGIITSITGGTLLISFLMMRRRAVGL